jgi:hypothetical protein
MNLIYLKSMVEKHLLKHLICIIFFTILYLEITKIYGSEEDKKNFSEFENTLYFTTVTHFTIGYGDLSPQSKMLKRLVILQIISAFLFTL